MICAVYRSSKRANTYLFLRKKDDFSIIPSDLKVLFGTPKLITLLPDTKMGKVVAIDTSLLTQELETKGYFLWLKSEDENLLQQHHRFVGYDKS